MGAQPSDRRDRDADELVRLPCLRWHRLVAIVALSILGIAAGSASAENLSVFSPVSPPASSIRGLFYLILAITGGIFVLVEGMLLYCIVRFRRSDPTDVSEPPQIYGSRPIEFAWTLAPALVVFVLFLIVVRTVQEIRVAAPVEGALEVTVVGHQWWWEYRYPSLGIRTANELHIPAGDAENPRPVILRLESADVIHSFWAPRLAGKTDVIPGWTNHMWIQADEPGVFLGQCAEYCGTQHANMMIRVVAQPQAEFDAWVADQKKKAADGSSAEAGRKLFFDLACMNCHSVDGTAARGTAGPDLTHLMARETLASGMIVNDREQRIRWVTDPQSIKPGCLMPGFKLTMEQVKQVVDYLETLR